MSIWAIIYLAGVIAGGIITAKEHGKPKVQNFWIAAVAQVALFFILFMGGFFS